VNIDVLALFNEGEVKPIAYRLNGVQHKIKEITTSYSFYEGQEKVRVVSVVDEAGDTVDLVYWPEKNKWKLKK
jgi:hypothetical protein